MLPKRSNKNQRSGRWNLKIDFTTAAPAEGLFNCLYSFSLDSHQHTRHPATFRKPLPAEVFLFLF
jgi:hypothetical protein